MKTSEIIEKYRDKIAEEMLERFRIVYECYGRIEYAIYIWEDGEIEVLEKAQGSNDYLRAKDCEDRALIYVDTVSAPFFDPFEGIDEHEDEDELAAMVRQMIDNRIEEIKREEKEPRPARPSEVEYLKNGIADYLFDNWDAYGLNPEEPILDQVLVEDFYVDNNHVCCAIQFADDNKWYTVCDNEGVITINS